MVTPKSGFSNSWIDKLLNSYFITKFQTLAPRRVAYINVDAQFTHQVTASTVYKPRPLFSLGNNSDTSFLSISSTQLTLQKGKYLISVPVGHYFSGGWTNFAFYSVTDALNYEQFSGIGYSFADVMSYTPVNFTVDISSTNVFEFRTASNNTSGQEIIGRITIEKLN